MPAGKVASKAAPSSDMSMVWKWVYAAGVVAAAVLGALQTTKVMEAPPVLGYLLILVGAIVGPFCFVSDDLEHFGLRYLVLCVAAWMPGVTSPNAGGPFYDLPAVGPWVSGFLGSVVLTMALAFMWKRRIVSLLRRV